MDPTIKMLKEQIRELHTAIELLQTNCKHPDLEKVAKSNTGNWCKQDDYYWFEFYCPTCTKRWTTPQ